MNRKWLSASVLLLVLILGCDESVLLPTAPPPVPPTSVPPSTSTGEVWIGGVVYGSGNRCLQDAVVEITAGKNSGTTAKNDCSSEYGYYRGYVLMDLREKDVVTLRASAPGHVPKEFEITVVSDMDGWHRHDMVLARE